MNKQIKRQSKLTAMCLGIITLGTLTISDCSGASSNKSVSTTLKAIDNNIMPFETTDEATATPTTATTSTAGVKVIKKKHKALTPEEVELANKLQQKAVDNYNEILCLQSPSRYNTVKDNLAFLEKKLKSTQAILKKDIDAFKSLNKVTYAKKIRIDKMQINKAMKDKRLIDLKDAYEQSKDILSYSIDTYSKKIQVLRKRIGIYKAELTDLAEINKEKGIDKKVMTWAEKDKLRKKEADATFKKISNELILKEYEKFLN